MTEAVGDFPGTCRGVVFIEEREEPVYHMRFDRRPDSIYNYEFLARTVSPYLIEAVALGDV